jgi:hypothetical protein
MLVLENEIPKCKINTFELSNRMKLTKDKGQEIRRLCPKD